jgi:polyisoprenoid-binding protein YceI
MDAHFQRDDLFDAAQFPTATFKSTAVESAGADKLRVTGDLTIHGVTRPTTFDVAINKIGEHPMRKVPAAGFTAEATIKRSDFGVDKYVPAIPDEVRISISTEALKAQPAAE